MPKQIMNYQNTLIYKLCCKDATITDVYIGHTTNFKQRKSGHKTSCNNEKSNNHNSYVYKFIGENGGWDNWDMILVEKFCCNDKLEALQKERYYIELFNASLNSYVPLRTDKEYYEANKDKIKEYYELNKDKIKQGKKEYYEQNKDKIKDKIKEYYELNKDKIKQGKKEYYEQNKIQRSILTVLRPT